MANQKGKKPEGKKQFFLIRWFKNLFHYFASSYAELKKVSWPTRKELFNHTWIVIVIIALFTAVTFCFDSLFSFLTNLIYKLV